MPKRPLSVTRVAGDQVRAGALGAEDADPGVAVADDGVAGDRQARDADPSLMSMPTRPLSLASTSVMVMPDLTPLMIQMPRPLRPPAWLLRDTVPPSIVRFVRPRRPATTGHGSRCRCCRRR